MCVCWVGQPLIKFVGLHTDSQVFLDLDEKDLKQINTLFREVNQFFIIIIITATILVTSTTVIFNASTIFCNYYCYHSCFSTLFLVLIVVWLSLLLLLIIIISRTPVKKVIKLWACSLFMPSQIFLGLFCGSVCTILLIS